MPENVEPMKASIEPAVLQTVKAGLLDIFAQQEVLPWTKIKTDMIAWMAKCEALFPAASA